VPDYRATLSGDIKGLRIGLIRHFYEDDNRAEDATRQGIAAAVKVFEDLGCSVRELRLSPLSDWAACGMIIMLSEAYAIHEATLRERFGDYGEMFRDRMALAALVTGGDYVQAVRRRRELAAEYATAMADLDLALTAAAPGEAPAIDAVGKFATFERPMLTMPFNVTGTPAMSVCCGYSAAGLPLAFQLAGKPFEESTVLRAAHAYEKSTPWRSVRPRLDL
jgi:aspartyl-tRNA(Asn)/glutamyl-tRNA(Gln) amidotransferase subunit A